MASREASRATMGQPGRVLRAAPNARARRARAPSDWREEGDDWRVGCLLGWASATVLGHEVGAR